MAVAYFKGHQRMAFWPLENQGELAVLFCFAFLYMASRGAGPWSIDEGVMSRRQARLQHR
jgi:putative oxidoreductase